jgi:hypothetical protein
VKLRTPVLVAWYDACSYHDHPGEDWIADALKTPGILTQSVGFLIAQSRKAVIIGTTIYEDIDPRTVLCIPRGMIKSIEVLHV